MAAEKLNDSPGGAMLITFFVSGNDAIFLELIFMYLYTHSQ